ncbi:MAG: DUF4135 domain-containing protein [Desulfobacter sp.]
MAYDNELGIGNLAAHNETLSRALTTRLKKIKLSLVDNSGENHRSALVAFYEPDLTWVLQRVRALGASAAVAEDAVTGFYQRCLMRFITPYLGKKADELRPRPTRQNEAQAVQAYNGFVSNQYGDLGRQNLFAVPMNESEDEYVTKSRMILLRENFMYFMKDLKTRLNASAADIQTRGLLSANAGFQSLIGISFTGSDPHHGTQMVLILKYQGGKVVYKPRDTRIDEVLVGSAHNTGNFPATQTIARLFNTYYNGASTPQGVHGYFIPMYKFLSCGDYGFIQFLKTDFSHHSEKHMRRYAWLVGVYAGICTMFGISDQHQGNIMLCQRALQNGTRHCLPHLTDLEIGVRNHILNQTAPDQLYQRLANTDITNGITNSTEIPEEGHWQYRTIGNSLMVSCTQINNNQQTVRTDNLPRRNNGVYFVHQQSYFAERFSSGFVDFYKTMRDRVPQADLLSTAALLARGKARIHALATGQQLGVMRHYTRTGTMKNSFHVVGANRNSFRQSLKEDCNRFDVAYYVKHLSGTHVGQVYHVTRGNVETQVPGAANVTGNNVYTTLRNYLQNLPDDVALHGLKNALLSRNW